jgi:AbrB family looped-hinge helix DNA binding protein
MRTTIDSAGRVVIPKAFREGLGLGRGGEVDIELVDGCVIVSPPVVTKHAVQRDGRVVIVADQPVPPLTDDVVDDVRGAVRR